MSDLLAAAPGTVKEAIQVIKVPLLCRSSNSSEAPFSRSHARVLFSLFVVHRNPAETSRRPLRGPRHQAESNHAGDPPGGVRVSRPGVLRHGHTEQAAAPESRGGRGRRGRIRASGHGAGGLKTGRSDFVIVLLFIFFFFKGEKWGL